MEHQIKLMMQIQIPTSQKHDLIFFSFTIIAKKVNGIANFKPNSSGINEPNIIPLIVITANKTKVLLLISKNIIMY